MNFEIDSVTLNIVLVGSQAVGKTSLVQKIVNKKFP